VPLTPLQERFLDEYLVDLNGAGAMRRAGSKCAPGIAAVFATETLGKPNVARRLEEKRAEIADQLHITRDRVLREVARIAFADLRRLVRWSNNATHFVPSDQLTADDAAAVSGVKAKHSVAVDPESGRETHTHELELRTYDKVGSLQKLIRHLGLEAEEHVHHTHELGPVTELSDEQLIERTLTLAGRMPGGAEVLLKRLRGAAAGAGNGNSGNGRRNGGNGAHGD